MPKELHIELDSADHEEPTWEVRPAGQSRRRRVDGRARKILGAAAAAAIVVNAGAAWAYWHITDSSSVRQTQAGTAVELVLRARNDLDTSFTPGGTSDLTVTVTNGYDFPIRILQVTPAAGAPVADDQHREAGCTAPGVSFTRPRFDVSWDVPRNTVGAFTVPRALTMTRGASRACAGAVFTIPVRVTGFRRQEN